MSIKDLKKTYIDTKGLVFNLFERTENKITIIEGVLDEDVNQYKKLYK
tara:strand:- start:386 stop:529 length:144 start_codon:yes stop_codon:yes gene_type:complete